MTDCRLPERCETCGHVKEFSKDDPIVRGDLVLRPGFQTAAWQGREVHLTAQQFAVLRFLTQREVARKEALYIAVFERMDRDGPDEKIVDVQVCKLRARLKEVGGEGLIKTLWGRGYTLDLTNGSPPVPTGQMRRSAKTQ